MIDTKSRQRQTTRALDPEATGIARALSQAKTRVLLFLPDNGRAVSNHEINLAQKLEDDDIVTVPTLIEDGLLRFHPATEAVSATALGNRVVAAWNRLSTCERGSAAGRGCA